MRLKTSCKSTIFSSNRQICCGGELLNLSQPKVMGILNLTTDSFYDGGRYLENKQILSRVEKLLHEGAAIIDIGAVSTRPGAEFIPVEEEKKKLLPVIKLIKDAFPKTILSIDTCWARVAEACVEAGADIINDISGGQFDDKMFETIAHLQVPYVLMHTQGKPHEMQQHPHYKDIIEDLTLFFSEQLHKLYKLGAKDVILDPGFGFGKNLSHNFELLDRLGELILYFKEPFLAGISRKSMVCKTLKVNPEKALNGTTALNTIALLKGASILRVHDAQEARECVELVAELGNYELSITN